MATPDFESMEAKEITSAALKYYRAYRTQKRLALLWASLVSRLTGRSVDDFSSKEGGRTVLDEEAVEAERSFFPDLISRLTDEDVDTFVLTGDDGGREVIDDAVIAYRAAGDSGVVLAKLKTALESSHAKVRELEHVCSRVQIDSASRDEATAATIKELRAELEAIRDADPIERRKETFGEVCQRRRYLPVTDLLAVRDAQSYMFNHLYSSEYVSPTKDGREELFRDQKEVEMNLVESCMALLRSQFDALPVGVVRVDRASIAYDIHPTLNRLQEARSRLSHMMDERAFEAFLRAHMRELGEVLDLFNSRSAGLASTDALHVNLTPWEKGLIYYQGPGEEGYLRSYERAVDLQKRLLMGAKASNRIAPFRFLEHFPTAYLFNQLEDVARVALVTSDPINNICFVRVKDSTGPDHFSYYYLDELADDKRKWKLDCHLLHVVRLFMDKYARRGGEVFRQFYRDVYGHNDYVPGFEEDMEVRGVERWKQMKVLWENIQIAGDEYLVGEIIRKVIRTHASLAPTEGVDELQSDKDVGDASAEFKRIRGRWKKGHPAWEDEPEEYLGTCFEKYRAWREDQTRGKYVGRWSKWLKQERYTQ